VGCARGLFWLQKSTSGVRSKNRFLAGRKPATNPLGLAIRPCARMVKGRWKLVSRQKCRVFSGRLPVISCPLFVCAKRKPSVTGSGPGVSRNGGGSTCRGKALWSHELIAFDEAVRDKDLAVNVGVSESWLAFFCDRECQRLCCELGVRKTTPSSGDRARRSYDRSSPGPREIFIRVSPRVSILLVSADESSATLKLERRRQAKLHSGVNKALRSRSYSTSRERLKGLDRACRESDSPEGARFESRLQKLVRHIFLVDSHGVTRGLGTE